MLEYQLAQLLPSVENFIQKFGFFRKLMIAIVLCFSATISIASADSFSCSEWSNSSLQHKGSVSIEIEKDVLIWSNGANSYRAKKIQNGTPQLSYSDMASIYMVFGVFSMNNKLYNSGYLRVRRIFFVEEILKFSEIECE
jgi:hypothetical protein